MISAMTPTTPFYTQIDQFVADRKVYQLTDTVKTLAFVVSRVITLRNPVLFDQVDVNELKVFVFFALLDLLDIEMIQQTFGQK